MITIDGSEGEGGGQILRTALALSLATLQPFGSNESARKGKSRACCDSISRQLSQAAKCSITGGRAREGRAFSAKAAIVSASTCGEAG